MNFNTTNPAPRNYVHTPVMPRVQTLSRGGCTVSWNTANGSTQILMSDATCNLKIEMVTLAGLYQFEMSRFDRASRFISWDDSRYTPSEFQKSCIHKYLKVLENKFDPRTLHLGRLGTDPRIKPVCIIPTISPLGDPRGPTMPIQTGVWGMPQGIARVNPVNDSTVRPSVSSPSQVNAPQSLQYSEVRHTPSQQNVTKPPSYSDVEKFRELRRILGTCTSNGDDRKYTTLASRSLAQAGTSLSRPEIHDVPPPNYRDVMSSLKGQGMRDASMMNGGTSASIIDLSMRSNTETPDSSQIVKVTLKRKNEVGEGSSDWEVTKVQRTGETRMDEDSDETSSISSAKMYEPKSPQYQPPGVKQELTSPEEPMSTCSEAMEIPLKREKEDDPTN